ncbi:hypothetical protein JCM14469_33000 [Desulfatiferula olefinivorans]
MEEQLAGHTDFDYLFGIAALESGRPVKASLAFERVLAVRPGFVGARMDLGRAYAAIGNYLKARQEFTIVLRQPNPPPLVKTVAARYMAMIEERLSKKKTELSGWVELSGGYDSNVNYATDDAVIEIPALQWTAVTLSDDNIEKDDSFLTYSLNLGLVHHASPALRPYVDIYGSRRLLADEKKFETDDLQLRTGIDIGESANTFQIGTTMGLSTLDRSVNSKQVGVNAAWRHRLDASDTITVFGRFDALRYPDVRVNNIDQWVGGIAWLHAVPLMRGSLLSASAYGGYAAATDHRADGDNDIFGIRLGYQASPFADMSIMAGVGGQFSDFKKENAVFQETRNDRQMDVRLAVNWAPIRILSIGCMLSHVHNHSTLPIHEYRRNDVSAMIRYHFL